MNMQQKIFKKLLEVPKGQITTYGELSKAVGMKNGQRAVGRIMNKNPYPVIIPCHRVVMSTGKVGGNTVRNKAHLRTLMEEIKAKRNN